MECKSCTEKAVGSCRLCGGFYCAKHGGVSFAGPYCDTCYRTQRVHFAIGALVLTGMGICCLTGAAAGKALDLQFLLHFLALANFCFAAFFVWAAFRRFPYQDRPNGQD